MVARVVVPEAPGGVVTVVNAHLENKRKASCRVQQMNYILENTRNTQHAPITVDLPLAPER